MALGNRRRAELPQLRSYTDRHRHHPRRRYIRLAALGILLIGVLVLSGPTLARRALRLIPSRYIMAYAPQPVQDFAFAHDPGSVLPTPEAAQADAEALLEAIAAMPTPTPAPTIPAAGAESVAPAYIQPTPIPAEPTPTATPGVEPAAALRAHEGGDIADTGKVTHLLSGVIWTRQLYNNCGPATITTYLTYWGLDISQEEAAAFLKPNEEDRNVGPHEIAAYVEAQGLRALVRVNGNIELMKKFIAAGYPVMIERGFDPEPDRLGWMGHYLVLIGYSDEDQAFIAQDSYLGPNRALPYNEMDHFWRHFNRTYIVVHRPDQAAAVASIVGANMDDGAMYARALSTAQLELNLSRNDAFAWFNLGSSLVALGRYQEAAAAFDEARKAGLPWRMLWYQFGPYEAYYQVGRYDDVLALADDTLAKNDQSEEAYYYKGLVYLARDQEDQARRHFKAALGRNPHYTAAQQALDALGDDG
jgi:tetratricopeptide (TPR) repeat protein